MVTLVLCERTCKESLSPSLCGFSGEDSRWAFRANVKAPSCSIHGERCLPPAPSSVFRGKQTLLPVGQKRRRGRDGLRQVTSETRPAAPSDERLPWERTGYGKKRDFWRRGRSSAFSRGACSSWTPRLRLLRNPFRRAGWRGDTVTTPQIFRPLSTEPAASKVITAWAAGRSEVGAGAQKTGLLEPSAQL